MLLLTACLCMTTSYAGRAFSSYDTTVGRFGGTGYAGNQTIATSGANGFLSSKFIGGGYQVAARMQKTNGSASGLYTDYFGANQSRSLPGYYQQTAGSKMRVQFKNKVSTRVNVQVRGSWKSNELKLSEPIFYFMKEDYNGQANDKGFKNTIFRNYNSFIDSLYWDLYFH
ncbi:MAG: hypothetical protein Q4P28_02070 [Tissierellia bacterium]|nr:hypothetical protein [Tissierellia bacterium]